MKTKHRLHLFIRRGRAMPLIAMACAGLLTMAGPRASEKNADPGWREQITSVLELMQQDARKARQAAGLESPRSVAPERTAAAAVDDRLQLTALYGSAGALTVVVHVNGARKEYRPGATLPYGGAGSRKEYRLERIVDTCVVLRKPGARGTRSVCYQPEAAPVPVAPPAPAVALDAPLPGFHLHP